MRTLILLALAGCGPGVVEPSSPAPLFATPVDVAVGPVVPGTSVRVTVSGLPDGVELAGALSGATSTSCELSLFVGTCTDLSQPAVRGTSTSLSVGGVGVVEIPVPAAIPVGESVFVQVAGRLGRARGISPVVESVTTEAVMCEEVQPLIDGSCGSCHGVAALGGLDLGNLAEVVGQDSVVVPLPLVVPGDADASYLVHKLEGTHTSVGGPGSLMPPTGPLAQEEIDSIRAWIDTGALCSTDAPAELPRIEPALRRLNPDQIVATLRAVYGPDVPVPEDLSVVQTIEGSVETGAAQATVQFSLARQVERAGLSVAAWLFEDADRLAEHGLCVPATTADACLREFMSAHAERLWRRPVTEEEVTAWLGLLDELEGEFASMEVSLEVGVAALLMSPHFIYRSELGEPDPLQPGAQRYTGPELASKLSYLLWGAPPDDELYQAALGGDLQDPTLYAAQVDRLMASPQFDDTLVRYYRTHLEVDKAPELQKDLDAFEKWTPSVAQAAAAEADFFLHRMVAEGADYRELFTYSQAYLNDDLAPLYDVTLPSGTAADAFALTPLPANANRRGLLGSVAWLAQHAGPDVPSPMGRGHAIRHTLFCEEFEFPVDLAEELADEFEEAANEGADLVAAGFTIARAEAQARLNNETCASCHQYMDPIGLGMENLDAIGMARSQEHGVAIDPSGLLDDTPFQSLTGLGPLLANDPTVQQCAARSLRRHLLGVDVEHDVLAWPQVDALASEFERGGFSVRALTRRLVLGDGFTRPAPVSDVIPPDLVAHWSFDGSDPGADASLGGYDLALPVNTTTIPGPVGDALELVGTSTDVPGEVFDQLSDELTVAMWVNASPTDYDRASIMSGSDASGGRAINIHAPWTDGRVYWDAGSDDAGSYDRLSYASSVAAFTDVWTHLAFTKNVRTGTMLLYVDGVEVARRTGATLPVTSIVRASLFGAYHGGVDDFRIYNTELEADRITALFELRDDGVE